MASMTTKIFTTADVAASRSCHPATVARIAKARQIGTRAGRDWIFTADQVEQLKNLIHDGIGNPNFGRKKLAAEKSRRKKTR
jgi:hypothetical protein